MQVIRILMVEENLTNSLVEAQSSSQPFSREWWIDILVAAHELESAEELEEELEDELDEMIESLSAYTQNGNVITGYMTDEMDELLTVILN